MITHNSYPQYISNDEILEIFKMIQVSLPIKAISLNTIDYEEMFKTLNFMVNMELNGHQITLKYWTKDKSYLAAIKNDDFDQTKQAIQALIELAVLSNVDKMKDFLGMD